MDLCGGCSGRRTAVGPLLAFASVALRSSFDSTWLAIQPLGALAAADSGGQRDHFQPLLSRSLHGHATRAVGGPQNTSRVSVSNAAANINHPRLAQPVEAETASRVEPEEPRQLPPMDQAAPKLEVPRAREPEQRPIKKYLMKRDQASESPPMPTNSPAKMARRQLESRTSPFNSQAPVAPEVPTEAERTRPSPERSVSSPQRQPQSFAASLAQPAPLQPELERATPPSLEGARTRDQALPAVGDAGLRSERRQRSIAHVQPAGSAPAPHTVAIARIDDAASRMVSPLDVPLSRRGQTRGAQLTQGATADTGLPSPQATLATGAARASDSSSARSGVPEVTGGAAERAPGHSPRLNLGAGMSPLGTPRFQPAGNPAVSESADTASATDRLDRQSLANRAEQGRAVASAPSLSPAGPSLDFLFEEGPVGFTEQTRPQSEVGIAIAEDLPRVGAMDLTRPARPKRDVGGPVTPFGSKIATVESFNRRVLRTQGGSAAPAAGLVAPATEEAIERGLSYLANIQNKDGSWSLQGHGSDVVLQSDTAATGLCLLAFQGAGYTHRQHQHADTVSRGLKFLMDNQKTNGDLYRVENAISNRNVAFYSHGIAALALCEAYGMTQDPELKEAAQDCLNYIIKTQHRQRGGWRYSPQVSSDTSVTGWMMMALKSGQLSGLDVPEKTYSGIENWLELAQSPDRPDRYRYNPFAPDTPTQRHGRVATPTMTAVGMLMRMYSGWRRDTEEMQSAADYLLQFPPQMGTERLPQRDAYYWYYATQVMFHMGGRHWDQWNQYLNPLLLESQINHGPNSGSWDPRYPVADRWSPHAGRIYVTTMNLLNLEVYYRHLPIYEETAH